jgi:outer membrane protein assembly factor BamD
VLAVLSLCLVLSGCGVNKSLFGAFGKGAEVQETAESLIQKGLDKFRHEKYHLALEIFEKVKSRYPFSETSLLAELKSADAHYYMDNYDEARLLYEEFEERHPTNEAIPYVLFQIGMCYYNKIDTIDRDTSGASSAVLAFRRLLRTFPASPYTDEAGTRILQAENFLASHEYYVADYYLRTGSLDEGKARLEYLLATYPMADISPRAAKILADLNAGKPPRKPWYTWVPGWTMFSSSRLDDIEL